MWGDKKEWTKEELISQLKPMCKYSMYLINIYTFHSMIFLLLLPFLLFSVMSPFITRNETALFSLCFVFFCFFFLQLNRYKTTHLLLLTRSITPAFLSYLKPFPISSALFMSVMSFIVVVYVCACLFLAVLSLPFWKNKKRYKKLMCMNSLVSDLQFTIMYLLCFSSPLLLSCEVILYHQHQTSIFFILISSSPPFENRPTGRSGGGGCFSYKLQKSKVVPLVSSFKQFLIKRHTEEKGHSSQNSLFYAFLTDTCVLIYFRFSW